MNTFIRKGKRVLIVVEGAYALRKQFAEACQPQFEIEAWDVGQAMRVIDGINAEATAELLAHVDLVIIADNFPPKYKADILACLEHDFKIRAIEKVPNKTELTGLLGRIIVKPEQDWLAARGAPQVNGQPPAHRNAEQLRVQRAEVARLRQAADEKNEQALKWMKEAAQLRQLADKLEANIPRD